MRFLLCFNKPNLAPHQAVQPCPKPVFRQIILFHSLFLLRESFFFYGIIVPQFFRRFLHKMMKDFLRQHRTIKAAALCGNFMSLTLLRFHVHQVLPQNPRLVSTQNLLANRSCSIMRYCLKYLMKEQRTHSLCQFTPGSSSSSSVVHQSARHSASPAHTHGCRVRILRECCPRTPSASPAGDNLPLPARVHRPCRSTTRGSGVIVRQCHAGAVQTVLGNLLYSAVGQCEHGFAGFGKRSLCRHEHASHPWSAGTAACPEWVSAAPDTGRTYRCADRHRRFRLCRDRLVPRSLTRVPAPAARNGGRFGRCFGSRVGQCDDRHAGVGSTAFCRCALPQITHADAAMMSAHSERMV